MKITFDPAKDLSNRESTAYRWRMLKRLEWDTLWAMPDVRRDYGEARMIGYAYIGLRLFNIVFVDRGDQRRVISLRKANSREINRYARA